MNNDNNNSPTGAPLEDESPFEFVTLARSALVMPESSRLTLDWIDGQADEVLREACRMLDVFPTHERRVRIIDICLHMETCDAARALARIVKAVLPDPRFVVNGWIVTSPN